ncbi:MAG: carbon-nitrogen hydrolase family protein [Opitutaceae bacterium]|nr:carbon-nitrogen hydrolase family protein [Opitutaceae bacterium]
MILVFGVVWVVGAEPPQTRPWQSRADSPPRKVRIATVMAGLSGPLAARLDTVERLMDDAAEAAPARSDGPRLDLIVLPEFAIARVDSPAAAERAVDLDGPVRERLGAKAAGHRTWLIAPMTLRESGRGGRVSNAAVLFDRSGQVAGIYRKVHPIEDAPGVHEGGVIQGDAYPVFECDFGRLGILICWDMGYDEAWAALAAGGAEVVALPSASPQTLRPSAAALRHRYYVVTSTPRDNVSIFDPIGRTVAQRTAAGALVHEIDLAYAILHWSEGLHEGRALRERFGESAVGGDYSTREDTGVFWSNDPRRTIGSMIGELGLREMPEMIEQMARRQP